MKRLDTYILVQIVWSFLFFALVFAGVIWLALSLRVIDTVISSARSAMILLELALLLLPKVLVIVIPVSAFAGVLYATSRLHSESEVEVMFASGISGRRLLYPVLIFAVCTTGFMYLLTTMLAPMAQRSILDQVNEVRNNVAAAFLRPGAFVTPEPNLTVYLRDTGQPGEILGIFIHDQRDPEQTMTYSARRAYFLDDSGSSRLVMFDGTIQRVSKDGGGSFSLLHFEQLDYNLSSITGSKVSRLRKPSEMSILELLTIRKDQTGHRKLGDFHAEAHEALSAPLYIIALSFLGFAFVVGNRKQYGPTGRIATAVITGVILRILGLAMKSATSSIAALWTTMYLPPLIGLALAFWLLSDSGIVLQRRILSRIS